MNIEVNNLKNLEFIIDARYNQLMEKIIDYLNKPDIDEKFYLK